MDGRDLILALFQGYKILTGSYVGKDALQIWNYSTDYSTDRKNKPQVVDFPAGDKGPFLYAAQFCDNNVVVAGGSGTNSAMAINTETNAVGIFTLDTLVLYPATMWNLSSVFLLSFSTFTVFDVTGRLVLVNLLLANLALKALGLS